MTVAEKLIEAWTTKMIGTELRVVEFVDLVLDLAVEHSPVIAIFSDHGVVFTVDSNSATTPTEQARASLRVALARLAKVFADASGKEFLPYGGEYEMRRTVHGNEYAFRIEFQNNNQVAPHLRVDVTRVREPDSR